ncbi:MAG TPA: pyridoxal-phosphate dependent enzyme, partial [Solirubrobacteraceae bacterium]|nr:pyridoxal-phosphate dependent enzyme [Solirubrobacteraceae bacterium]
MRGARAGVLEVADVGTSGSASWVIDGYATLFDETKRQGSYDTILVPVGVGSLAAAAARFGARSETTVVAVEPVTAGCLTASPAAGLPTTVATPGTTMLRLIAGRSRRRHGP